MVKRIKVSEAYVEQAYQNWVDFHYGWDCEEAITRFFTWIDPYYKDHEAIDPWTDRKTLHVLPQTKSRIDMLAGPNHVTYLKAWYVNNPWK